MLKEKIALTNEIFKIYQKIVFSETGISLYSSKISLVQSRLYKRLLHYNLTSYSQYLRIIQIDNKEKMEMINLITTNETYFFREESHFKFLIEYIQQNSEEVKIWSAASSVGAEAYTIGMILDNYLSKDDWSVIGSDINSEVIKKARSGLYPIHWLDKIPDGYKKKYCLKGKGKYENQFLINRPLAKNITFVINNLMKANHHIKL